MNNETNISITSSPENNTMPVATLVVDLGKDDSVCSPNKRQPRDEFPPKTATNV